jgi:hypothetical protein
MAPSDGVSIKYRLEEHITWPTNVVAMKKFHCGGTIVMGETLRAS